MFQGRLFDVVQSSLVNRFFLLRLLVLYRNLNFDWSMQRSFFAWRRITLACSICFVGMIFLSSFCFESSFRLEGIVDELVSIRTGFDCSLASFLTDSQEFIRFALGNFRLREMLFLVIEPFDQIFAILDFQFRAVLACFGVLHLKEIGDLIFDIIVLLRYPHG